MTSGKQRSIEAMRRELLHSSESLLGHSESDALGRALRHFFPGLKHAFVVHSIPEQAEDIYWILINSTEIAEIEIPRDDNILVNSISLKILNIGVYASKSLLREARRKLEIGVELMKNV